MQIFMVLMMMHLSLFAQLSEMHIAGKPEKLTAPIPEVRDINGRICAAIYIVADMEGFKYDSYQGVVKVIDQKGFDIVFLSPDERVLEIYHTGYQPLKISLSELGIHVDSHQGWKIALTAEKMLTQKPVVFDLYPDSTAITIDDTDYGVGKLFMLSNGKHKIQLRRSGFATLSDSIVVDQNQCQFKFELAPQLDMVFVKGDSFWMGDTFDEGYDDEKPVHQVAMRDFYISKYEVTYAAYDVFCEKTGQIEPDNKRWGANNHPVINVSWYEAVVFCNWLSQKHGLTPCYQIDTEKRDPNNKKQFDDKKWTVTRNANANGYRLPTEAEWEYAAKGGSKSRGYKYSGSNNIDEVAWYVNNSVRIQPVGMNQPNELGIYDMSGNVLEWCWDWYDENYYANSPPSNPEGPVSGEDRVVRGGSGLWSINVDNCRSVDRNGGEPNVGYPAVGFRLVHGSPQRK